MPPDPAVINIDRMPRGGPDASRVDRRLQTHRLEYLDRDDVNDRVRRQEEEPWPPAVICTTSPST
jgi:hypothetical protein